MTDFLRLFCTAWVTDIVVGLSPLLANFVSPSLLLLFDAALFLRFFDPP